MTKRGTFQIGEIVFATCIGLKPWPAIITKIDPLQLRKNRLSFLYDVKFINHPSSANLLEKDLTDFTTQKIEFLQNLYKNSTDQQEMGILKAIKVALEKRQKWKSEQTMSNINTYPSNRYEDKINFLRLEYYDTNQSCQDQMLEQSQPSSNEPSDYLNQIQLFKSNEYEQIANLQHLNSQEKQEISKRQNQIIYKKISKKTSIKKKRKYANLMNYKTSQKMDKQDRQISVIEISDSIPEVFPKVNQNNITQIKPSSAYSFNQNFLLSVEWHNHYETIINCQHQMKFYLQSYPQNEIHSFIHKFLQKTVYYLINNKNNTQYNECHPLERKYAFVGCLANSNLESLLRNNCFEIMIKLIMNYRMSMKIEQLNCFGEFVLIIKKVEECFCQYLNNSNQLNLSQNERNEVQQLLNLYQRQCC